MIRTDYIWLDMIDIIETNLIVATCVQSNQISSDLINPAPGLQKYSSERAVGQNPLKHLKHSETLLPWSTLQKTHRFWCFPKWSLGRSPSKKRDAWVHFPGLRIVCLFRFNEARRAPKWPQWSKWGISKDCNSTAKGQLKLEFCGKAEGSADAQRVINQDLSCASSMMHSGKLFAHFRRWLCSTKVSVPVTLGNVCRTRYSKKNLAESLEVIWRSLGSLGILTLFLCISITIC